MAEREREREKKKESVRARERESERARESESERRHDSDLLLPQGQMRKQCTQVARQGVDESQCQAHAEGNLDRQYFLFENDKKRSVKMNKQSRKKLHQKTNRERSFCLSSDCQLR